MTGAPGDADAKQLRELHVKEHLRAGQVARAAGWGPRAGAPARPRARYTAIHGRARALRRSSSSAGRERPGVARDCAMRGLSVLLLERADLACGASGASSGMIHGGIRYMTSDRKVTRLACRDAGFIRRIAPHLVFRIPFLLPFSSRGEEATLAERAAWYATEVYVAPTTSTSRSREASPPPGSAPRSCTRSSPPCARPARGVTLDEWGIDGPRLCLLNACRPRPTEPRCAPGRRPPACSGRAGAPSRWAGATASPARTARRGRGDPERHRRLVAVVGRRSGVEVPMRPGKGVHLSLDRRFSNYGVICKAVDGRQMFLMPHEEESIIGTTDDDFYGDPDDLRRASTRSPTCSRRGVARAVGPPGARHAGLERGADHPPRVRGDRGRALREHQILDHSAEGAAGLLSFVGGKLASYRAQAEEATDRIVEMLGRAAAPCRTHEEPLPGGESVPDVRELASRHRVAEGAVARLVFRQGSRAEEVLRLADEDPRLKLVVCRDEGLLAAEVVWICRHEKVRRLQDLRRRCRLAVAGCGGLDCARLAAQLAAHELGWDADRLRAELHDLLEVGWRERRPVLDGWQLAEEELLRAVHRGLGGL